MVVLKDVQIVRMSSFGASGKFSKFLPEPIVVCPLIFIYSTRWGCLLKWSQAGLSKHGLVVGNPGYDSYLVYKGVIVCQEQIECT